MEHSYLVISLVLTMLGLLAAAIMPGQRGVVLMAGGLAAPAGLADLIFVPEYWTPVHLIGAWFSVEGLLFSFGNGCLIGVLVARLAPLTSLPQPARLVRQLLRLSALMLLGFVVFILTWQGALGGLMVMHAVLLGLAAMLAALALAGGFRSSLAAAAGLGFGVLYLLQTLLWHRLDPGFPGFWQAEAAYLGRVPVTPHLPVEEFLWAGLYGAVWASMLVFAFGTEPRIRRL